MGDAASVSLLPVIASLACAFPATCLPDGTCRVECEDGEGAGCWVILACDGEGGCEVVDSGGGCCAASEE